MQRSHFISCACRRAVGLVRVHSSETRLFIHFSAIKGFLIISDSLMHIVCSDMHQLRGGYIVEGALPLYHETLQHVKMNLCCMGFSGRHKATDYQLLGSQAAESVLSR